MKDRFEGRCECGKVTFELALPQDLSAYTPRACDCDFCREHQADYLSDPQGTVTLQSSNALETRLQHEGGKAGFLFCRECAGLLGVTYLEAGKTYGAVNSNRLQGRERLQPAVVVSPQKLSIEERVERWKALWCEVKLSQ